MNGSSRGLYRFFYFYFGDDTQPHLLRTGESAVAGEEA